MTAGITVPYDRQGFQTADLVQNQWPLRPGEHPVIREFSTTTGHYGTGVRCHAGQSYQPPSNPAGTSKRMGAFYEKTGVMQHRTEPGFRDTKGAATLTEAPVDNYGTLRPSALPKTGSMVLSGTGREPQKFYTRGHPQYERPRPMISDDAVSVRSRGSRASGVSRGSRGSRQSDGGMSVGSAAISETPSWARRTNLRSAPAPWNFETLPMYEKSSENYGKKPRDPSGHHIRHPAGKSESGFLSPAELVKTLTRAEY